MKMILQAVWAFFVAVKTQIRSPALFSIGWELIQQMGNLRAVLRGQQILNVVLIAPSRYDPENGFVISSWRGVLPNSSLATIYNLVLRQRLGPNVRLVLRVYDEYVQQVRIGRIAKLCGFWNAMSLVMLTGVQNNQFPRATDLALEFRKRGIQVIIGGFHVSGVLAQFPQDGGVVNRRAFREFGLLGLVENGVSLFAGEAEGRIGMVLQDFLAGRSQPIYNFIGKPPDLSQEPFPIIYPVLRSRIFVRFAVPLQPCRGCPFRCRFCPTPVVHGRVIRSHSMSCFETAVRENYQRGARYFVFTADNLARDPYWEQKFDFLIALKEKEGKRIRFMMQADTGCHRIPRFLEKAALAGCRIMFSGMESVNPRNLAAINKPHNRVEEYQELVQAAHTYGIAIHFGYMIGLPADTPESIAQDVETLLGLHPDLVTFSLVTPLPGADDHRELFCQGQPMDPDLNAYDLMTRPVTAHPIMSQEEWMAAFQAAWSKFYSVENVASFLRKGGNYGRDLWRIAWYKYAIDVLGQHPMGSGFHRKRYRRARRPGFPKLNWIQFQLFRAREAVQIGKKFRQLALELVEIWLQSREKEAGKGISRWLGDRATRSDVAAYWSSLTGRLVRNDFRCLFSRELLRYAWLDLVIMFGFLHALFSHLQSYLEEN